MPMFMFLLPTVNNFIYKIQIQISATILNWQIERAETMEDCSPPNKVQKALAGSAKYQSRLNKEW